MNAAALARAVALGLAAAVAAAVALAATGRPAAMDFVAQYAAATLVLAGRGGEILDPAAVLAAERAASPDRAALLPFVQPPAVALLLSPLALLPFEPAFRVMAALDAAAIGVGLALLRPAVGSLGVSLLLLAPPSVIAVAEGQTSPLVLLLVALAARTGPLVGGLALGLTALRPQTAPLLVLAALADPARRVWAIAGSLAVVGPSALVVGPEGLLRYVGVLADASLWSASGALGLSRSIGWSGLALAVGPGAVGLVLSAVGAVLGAVAVLRAERHERASAAAAWSLVASPHVLMHDALLAYPVIVRATARRAAWDVASVAAWLVHLVGPPVAVLWSLVLALVGSRPYPRPTR